MFYAVARWNGYIWAQMILQTDDQPLTCYLNLEMEKEITNLENGGRITDYSVYSLRYAFIVCSIIPIVLVYPKLQKYFAAGVNVGGVKE